MTHQMRKIVHCAAAFIWASATCLITFALSLADIYLFPQEHFTEYGLVEWAQEALLFLAAAMYGYLGLRSNDTFYQLVSGFLLCMFIRELDFLFDFIKHGAWQYVAIAAAAVCIYRVSRSGIRKICDDLCSGIDSRSFFWLFIGLIVVLVFSRLFGMNLFWRSCLGDHFMYDVKRAIEEFTELWGYLLIMTSAASCFIEKNRRS